MLAWAWIQYAVFMRAQSASDFDGPAVYQITVRGVIAPARSDCLEGMTISRLSLEDGTIYTFLAGELTDQAALTGVLNTLYQWQMPLVAVTKLPAVTRSDL